ncbi:MAG: hypothetical protein ACREBC_36505 [Pyrinomonadaceae bacterium]
MCRADASGPRYPGADDGEERGLAGPFVCASLAIQFEFIMSQWVNSSTFPGGKAQTGIDRLLGNVPDGSAFTYWNDPKQPVTAPGLSRL